MLRLIFISLCCLLPALILAQAPAVVPLTGKVTIVQPAWQFYTDIGTHEQLYVGATLQVMRGGAVIGTARVIKVGYLDSIAELTSESPRVLLQAGDTVVVQTNPTTTRQSGELPWIEPSMNMASEERNDLLLILLIGLGVALSD